MPHSPLDAEPSSGGHPIYSPASIISALSLPNVRLSTSADAGWRSVLLEHHRSEGVSEPFEPLATPDQTIVVATKGEHSIDVYRRGSWRKGMDQAGCSGMTAGGSRSRLRWSSQSAAGHFQTAHLYVPQHFFSEALDHYRRAGQLSREEPLSAFVFRDDTVAHSVWSLLRAMAVGAPDLYAESVARLLATHLLARHSPWLAIGEDSRRPAPISDRRLARVIDLMGTHLAEPLTLTRLASEAGVSKFHFVHLFRKQIGSPPHSHLVQLRMGAACRMLATTDLSVAEVALACGYERPKSFGAAFANRYGLSPIEFRKAQARSVR